MLDTTPEEIAEHDPSYVVWMYDTVSPKRCSKTLALACEGDDDAKYEDAMGQEGWE